MAERGEAEGTKLILKNKRAFHNYEILERLECGLALQGTEVKSLREGAVSFADSYVTARDGELSLVGLNISEYKMGNRMNHEPVRKRRLLARKRQIGKLQVAVSQKGLTIVPLALYWKRGLAKVEIGLARGKALYDKRESIRKREDERGMRRALRARDR